MQTYIHPINICSLKQAPENSISLGATELKNEYTRYENLSNLPNRVRRFNQDLFSSFLLADFEENVSFF